MRKIIIDYKKTKEEVAKFMDTYMLLTYASAEEDLPVITKSFVMSVNSNNKDTSEETENEKLFNEYKGNVVYSFNRLNIEERKYLNYKYFNNKTDEDIQNDMGYGFRGFRRLKRDALHKFAILLDLVVYVDETNEKINKKRKSESRN